MHVPSNRRDPQRQRWRGPVAALSMLALLSIGGAARAAAFDEKMKAPMMNATSDVRPQAEALTAKFRALRQEDPEQLVRDPALARQKFDLKWQVLRAVELRKPVEDAATLGLISQGDGTYRIDLAAYPQWDDLHETIAGVLSRANLDATGPALIARGFRDEDLVTLKNYVARHDPDLMARKASAAVTLEFARVVRKHDKLKRPIPDSLVESFYYQRTRAASESKRKWVEGLLDQLDAQRDRVLLSTFVETEPFAIWAPSDFASARDELLMQVRKPDFEATIKAAVEGVAP
jgi:hypothetical protein